MSNSITGRIADALRHWGNKHHASFVRFTHRSAPAIATLTAVLNVLVAVAAVVFICSLFIYAGYDHSAA